MQVTTEYFVNDWNKQVVLENYNNEEYVVVEREVYHFEGSIEVSEVANRFQTEAEALEYLQCIHGFDFGFEPDYTINPEWDEIPF